jgi:hypothetical protein
MKLLILLLVLQALDVASTLYGFKLGLREGNPLLAKLQPILGRDGAIVFPKLLFCALVIYFHAALAPMTYLLGGLCALYVYVVYRNVRVIRNAHS